MLSVHQISRRMLASGSLHTDFQSSRGLAGKELFITEVKLVLRRRLFDTQGTKRQARGLTKGAIFWSQTAVEV